MKPAIPPMDIARQVQEARRGSQAAYTWLYCRFAPLVHAIHLGKSMRARVEDLTQETFVIAFSRLHQLRDAERFGPWIAVIARRTWSPDGVEAIDIAACEEPLWVGTGPEVMAEAGEVLQAIRTLPQAYRETLLLRLVEGLSGPEIADLTGLTPDSVRVNLHRGMSRLRSALGIAARQEDDNET